MCMNLIHLKKEVKLALFCKMMRDELLMNWSRDRLSSATIHQTSNNEEKTIFFEEDRSVGVMGLDIVKTSSDK